MSTIPAKKIECKRNNPDGRVCAPPATHTYDGEGVYCFAVGGGT